MDWLTSSARQFKNYGTLFGTRALSLGSKYLKRGNASFSTPRVPHATSKDAPSTYKTIKNTIKAFFMSPTVLLDSPKVCMYVGSALNTASERTYTQEKVTHILNCAGDDDILPMFYAECIQCYLHISLRDESDEMCDFVEDQRFGSQLHEFLGDIFSQKRDPSNRVVFLVHCVFGRSRSVAICTIILFLYNQFLKTPKSMVQCYEYIGEKRHVVEMNRRFLAELSKFEAKFEEDEAFRNKWMSIFN